MQPFYTVIEPGGGSRDPYSHVGEEFGIVLEGSLTLDGRGKGFSGPGRTQLLLFLPDPSRLDEQREDPDRGRLGGQSTELVGGTRFENFMFEFQTHRSINMSTVYVKNIGLLLSGDVANPILSPMPFLSRTVS